MITSITKAVLFSAALLAAMWAGSLWVYDGEKMADALEWRWAELNGEPLYAWPFDVKTEITSGHGLRRFSWYDGTLQGEIADPYFYLNLEGRYIDARRFNELLIRLWSRDRNELLLFHHQLGDHRIHASERVPVEAGWQTLTLSLTALEWHAKDPTRADGPVDPSQWGGAGTVITQLRVDPVEAGEFEVDWIELVDSETRPNLVADIDTFAGLDDPLFERMRQEPDRTWHIAQDTWPRTPETAHWARQKIATEFPSAIVFPRPPRAEQLAYPPFESGPLSAFVPAGIFVAALLFMVVRDQFPARWRPVVAVVALFTVIEAYLYWMPSLSSPWRVLLAIPVLGAMWELAPKAVPRYLLGDARAWAWVSPVLVLSILVLLLAPYRGPEDYSVIEVLATYLLWALFQQFVVAELILSRLKPVLGSLAIIASAGIFGFFHFPNFALMAATFALGIGLLHIYQRHQNLLAIATAQAFMSVAFNSLALQYFWLSRTVGPTFTVAL